MSDVKDGEQPTMKITNLTIKEGSFVKQGANQHAFIRLFKSAESKLGDAFRRLFSKDGASEAAPQTTSQVLDEQQFWTKWSEIKDAFLYSCHEIMESDAPNKRDLLTQSAKEFVAGLESIASGSNAPVAMEAIEAALEGYVATAEQQNTWQLQDLKKTLEQFHQQAPVAARENTMQKEQGMTAEQTAALEAMCKAMNDEQKKSAIAYVMGKMDKPMAVEAPAVPAAKELVLPESVRKELADAKAERESLTKALETERDLRITKELTDEVKSFGATAGVTTEQAVLLLKAADMGKPIDGKHLRAMLKASGEISKLSAVLTQFGHNGEAPDSAAVSQVEKLAKEYSVAHKVSLVIAKNEIYKLRPELLEAEISEEEAGKAARRSQLS